jgi:hypothetical protein
MLPFCQGRTIGNVSSRCCIQPCWGMTMPFKPFIGHRYGKGIFGECKVLLVGESHYDGDHDTLTKEVVSKAANGNGHGFFNRIAAACVGDDTYRADTKAFWQSVAFINYVHCCVGGPRDRPTRQMLADSEQPFRHTLDKHKPARVIVFSSVAWKWVPADISAGGMEGVAGRLAPITRAPGISSRRTDEQAIGASSSSNSLRPIYSDHPGAAVRNVRSPACLAGEEVCARTHGKSSAF